MRKRSRRLDFRSLRRPAQAVVLVLLALAVTGCTRLIYNRLDSLAGWYLESLVALDEQQSGDLRVFLDDTLEWHRQSELTRYGQFLRDLAAEAAQPGSPASYERIEERIDSFGSALIDRAAPQAATLLLSLTPEQVDELNESLEEKSIERNANAQEAIAKGTWPQRQAKSTQKQLKRWTGTVTSEQKQLIQGSVATLEPANSDWLESLRQWRGSLRSALLAESRDEAQQRVLQLLRTPDTEWTSDYLAKTERNRVRVLELMQALDHSLTAAQRTHLQRELTQLAQQLESLTED